MNKMRQCGWMQNSASLGIGTHCLKSILNGSFWRQSLSLNKVIQNKAVKNYLNIARIGKKNSRKEFKQLALFLKILISAKSRQKYYKMRKMQGLLGITRFQLAG